MIYVVVGECGGSPGDEPYRWLVTAYRSKISAWIRCSDLTAHYEKARAQCTGIGEQDGQKLEDLMLPHDPSFQSDVWLGADYSVVELEFID